jgi:hypothetical protein
MKDIDISYFCKHVVRTVHSPIRCYSEGKMTEAYGDSDITPKEIDSELLNLLIDSANEEYPYIHMTQDYAYYAVIKMTDRQLIVGPVYLEKKREYI